MYILDFYDILFFIKALKQPSDHFNIHHHVSFSTSNTRSASTNKLNPTHTNSNYFRNFYFNRLPRIWNKLPSIDLSLSLPTIKTIIYNYIYINILLNTFHPVIHVPFTSAAGVVTVTTRDISVIFQPYN